VSAVYSSQLGLHGCVKSFQSAIPYKMSFYLFRTSTSKCSCNSTRRNIAEMTNAKIHAARLCYFNSLTETIRE